MGKKPTIRIMLKESRYQELKIQYQCFVGNQMTWEGYQKWFHLNRIKI